MKSLFTVATELSAALASAGAFAASVSRVGKAVYVLASLAVATAAPSWAQSIDSRLGKLEVIDGYPGDATLERLYDEVDFQRACQAFLWGLPAVAFHGMHLAHLKTFGAKDGGMVLYRDLKDKAGMLTPNITTIYMMCFWDLEKQGPVVIEIPPGASAGGVIDVWQRPVTDVGQTGADKGKAGSS